MYTTLPTLAELGGGCQTDCEVVMICSEFVVKSTLLFTLKQALASHRHFRQLSRDCDGEIENYLHEFFDHTG